MVWGLETHIEEISHYSRRLVTFLVRVWLKSLPLRKISLKSDSMRLGKPPTGK